MTFLTYDLLSCVTNMPLLTTHNTIHEVLSLDFWNGGKHPTCCDNMLHHIIFIKYFILNITKT